jgi:hypothetical protein
MNSNLIRAIAQSAVQAGIQKAANSNDGSVKTTDNTPATIAAITTLPYTAGVVEYTVLGLLADGSAAVTQTSSVRYLNNGSTLVAGTPVALLPVQTDGLSASVSVSVSGNDLLIQVAGGATNTINWQIYLSHRLLNVVPDSTILT